MSYNNPCITMNDSVMDMVVKISEGNPGALSVLMKILKEGEAIDPQCHPMLTVMALDTHDIYGPRVWQLYKDVCGQSLVNMLGLLRAVQLGFMAERELSGAIDSGPLSADRMQEMMAKVRSRLEGFSKESE